MRNNCKSLIIINMIILALLAAYLSGWSLLPFGKRYLPDYFFDDVTHGIKGYIRPNDRLILLNDSIFHPQEGKYALGISHASTIVEYSSKKATEIFGKDGQYGAVKITGKNAKIIYGAEGKDRTDKKMALLFIHNTPSIPSPSKLALDALHSTGEKDDTLFIGSLRYRLQGDTSIILTPDNMYYVTSSDKKRKGKNRRLLIYRYGRLDTILAGIIKVNVNAMDSKAGLYHYNERIATYHKWAANTLVGIRYNYHLLHINGKNIIEPITRVQVTGDSICYLNGIEAVKKYGLKGLYGAVEISGNSLKYFSR